MNGNRIDYIVIETHGFKQHFSQKTDLKLLEGEEIGFRNVPQNLRLDMLN